MKIFLIFQALLGKNGKLFVTWHKKPCGRGVHTHNHHQYIQTKHLCSCAESAVGYVIDCLSNQGTQTFSGDSLDEFDSGSDTEESGTKDAYNEISRIES